MSASKIIFTILFLSSAAWVSAGRADSDIEYEKRVVFEVKGKKGKYKLSSIVEVAETFLNKRAAEENNIYITEDYCVEIKYLKAYFRGKKLKKDRIFTVYPKRADEFFSEVKAYVIHLPENIKAGETLSYRYCEKYSDIAYFPIIEIPNVDLIKEYEISIEHPKQVSASFDFFFPRDSVPFEITRPDEKLTILSFGALDGAKKLPYYNFNDIQAAVLVTLYEEGRAINPTSVDNFVNWYAGLTDLHPEIEVVNGDLAHCRTAGLTVVKDKISVINDYVKENVRYIMDSRPGHAIVPYEASQVLEKMYGDCKDRSSLVVALAAGENIPVAMALVGRRLFMDFEGTHPFLFNHVICAWEDDEKTVFFDPTAKYYPFGGLPYEIIGQTALVLDTAEPRKTIIPLVWREPSITLNISAGLDSLDCGRAEIILCNDELAYYHRADKELTGLKLENYLDDLITARFYKISLDNFTVEGEVEDRLFLSAEADLTNFILTSEVYRYIPRTPFITVGNNIFDREEDRWPLHFEKPYWLELNINLESREFTVKPDTTRLGDEGNFYFQAVAGADTSRTVSLEYIYKRLPKIIASEEKGDFINQCREYLASKKKMFVLQRRNK